MAVEVKAVLADEIVKFQQVKNLLDDLAAYVKTPTESVAVGRLRMAAALGLLPATTAGVGQLKGTLTADQVQRINFFYQHLTGGTPITSLIS